MIRAQVLEPIELGVRKAFMAHRIASHTHSGYGDMRYSKNEVAKPLFAEPDGFIVIDVDDQNRSNISKLIM